MATSATPQRRPSSKQSMRVNLKQARPIDPQKPAKGCSDCPISKQKSHGRETMASQYIVSVCSLATDGRLKLLQARKAQGCLIAGVIIFGIDNVFFRILDEHSDLVVIQLFKRKRLLDQNLQS